MPTAGFCKPVYPGDTLNAVSEVIGLKENSNSKTGIVYVRSRGFNQDGADVLRLCALGDGAQARRERRRRPANMCRSCPKSVDAGAARRRLPADRCAGYDTVLAGSPHRFGDYHVGEKIDHVAGITVEDAEHMIATRLYQNTARIHFDHFTESKGRFGRRLIYGGHAISLARALSFNGLANAFHVAAINGGRHVAPLFAGHHRVRLVGGAGDRRYAGPQRRRRVAPAHRRDQGSALRRLSVQDRRRLRPGGDSRSRLLGADAEVRRRPRTQEGEADDGRRDGA